MAEINGHIEPGYEPVGDAFAANFDTRGDVGAAFALYRHGVAVVDLWGGLADPDAGRPWERDTLEVIFSSTKGATATCALLLVERGELDLDAPVAEYWPEFAANGKDAIPVRWLLSHQSGLPALDVPPRPDDLYAWDPFVSALAAQKPLWTPGAAHGYHAGTFGFLVGEVVRRVSGRTIGRFFADEIAGPLGLDFWIGLPEREEPRVARLVDPPQGIESIDVSTLSPEVRSMIEAARDPSSLRNRAVNLTRPPLDFDSRAMRAAEMPSSGGVATARSLARFYAGLIGEVDGVRVIDDDTLKRACEEQAAGVDEIVGQPSRYGLGFWLSSPMCPMAGPSSFGHPGKGGSLGFADPATGFAFGYVMNQLLASPAGDRRTPALIEACLACA
jgi:CubicO group peptidase (beta-lactamase class C family)